MSPVPDLPTAAHHQVDSMLARKFGPEVANYFAGSPLNRVSFLREQHGFLAAAAAHPSAAYVLLNQLAPLVTDPAHLAVARLADVAPLVGPAPFAKSDAEAIKEFRSDLTQPIVLFLGLDERKKDNVFQHGLYTGQPYFAVDVTPKGTLEKAANGVIAEMTARGLSFAEGRIHMLFDYHDAAIYGQARAYMDWNARNPFCGGCGQPTLSVNAGTKRVCPSTDLAPGTQTDGAPRQRGACPTRQGISNLSFPRTDPTIIVAVVSADGQRLLLGRQKRWPPHFYSTLAGFCEPAESIEEAVRREVWEEAGVAIGRVVIHSTQPWPFPANLMIGAVAQALPGGEDILLAHDPELEHAKWWTMDEVRTAIEVGSSNLGEAAGPGYREGDLRIPGRTAIAHQLMLAVANGFAGDVEARI